MDICKLWFHTLVQNLQRQEKYRNRQVKHVKGNVYTTVKFILIRSKMTKGRLAHLYFRLPYTS